MRTYVLCPPAPATGGTEALHQFVHQAVRLGHDARICYFPSADGPVPQAFASYEAPVDQHVIDEPGALVVAPEVMPEVLLQLRFARRALWWLSIDNALRIERARQAQTGETESTLDRLLRPASGTIHLAQSEYARRYLAERGAAPRMVTDYIPPAFHRRITELRGSRTFDVVLYNPKKGAEFTRRLIDASRGRLDWVPIEGLSTDEVAELLTYSKVYVDFGEHPGRDRIPREAALAGCVVVAGSRGAAGNRIDLPIPEEFVFDEAQPGVVEAVVDCVAAAIADYDTAVARFTPYREWVTGQQDAFAGEVGAFLRSVQFAHRRAPASNRQRAQRRRRAGRR